MTSINKDNTRLKVVSEGAKELVNSQGNDTLKLDQMENELRELARKLGVPISDQHKPLSTNKTDALSWDSELFLQENNQLLESKISKEIYEKPDIFPELDKMDIAVVSIAGVMAAILDILIVKVPKDINYLGKYNQDGSSLTGFFRKCGVDEKGNLNAFLAWLEDKCKVPFDRVKGIPVEGIYPKTHRLLSLGHDPILGMIFGILDIWNGSLSAIDINGNFRIIKTIDVEDPIELILAPLMWIGHIVSDICTSMGIPIPGWGFLQLMQFGSFGEKQRTIAEISRWMYVNGYDVRHLLTMAIAPATVELIIRGYHHLNRYYEEQDDLRGMPTIAEREMREISNNLKLHKMLFFAHAMAASGNALKVAMYHGNPLAVNIAQWGACLKESVTMVKSTRRDRSAEMIKRNRDVIDDKWREISSIKIGNLHKESSIIYLDMYRR